MKTPLFHRAPSLIEPLESRIAPAAVLSITRTTPSAAATAASSVVYTVTFDGPVTGVDAVDFVAVTSGDLAIGDLSVTPKTTSVYSVTINGIHGNGKLRLDLGNNLSITGNGQENFLQQGYFGPTYDILQTGPKATITTVGGPNTELTTVSWTVTFSEKVTGVDLTDFSLVLGGGLTGGTLALTPATGANAGKVFTVTASGLIGQGTAALDLLDDGTIKDLEGNLLQTSTADRGVAVSFVSKPNTAPTASNAVAVAAGDLNGDGVNDLVVVGNSTQKVSVLLGNKDGTGKADGSFATAVDYSVAGNPRDVAIADVNGDGVPDLVVTGSTYTGTPPNFQSAVSVLLGTKGGNGKGDGTFQPKVNYGNGSSVSSVAVADVNNDGKADIIFTSNNSSSPVVSVLIGTGNGSFLTQKNFAVGSDPRSVQVADLNGDGRADLVVANRNGNNVSVLLGTAATSEGGPVLFDPQTTFAAGTTPTGVAVGDLDGDGKLDLAVSNETTGAVSILRGSGNGSFGTATTASTSGSPTAIVLTDVNGDGKLDIVVPSSSQPPAFAIASAAVSGEIAVLLGNGDATFGNSITFNSGGAAIDLAASDFNGDGRADIATANGFSNSTSQLINNGDGHQHGPSFTVAPVPPDLAILSLDRDGVVGITDGKTLANAGDTLSYTIKFKNRATKTATGTKLTVSLPVDTIFNASENPGWTFDSGVLTKTIGTLKGNATGSTKLKLHVKDSVSSFNSTIGTTVVISDDGTHGGETEQQLTDNTATDYDSIVNAAPDLAVDSIDSNKFAVVFRSLVYTINVSNNGDRDAGGEIITVNIPEGTTFNAGLSTAGWTLVSGSSTQMELNKSTVIPGKGGTFSAVFAVDVGIPNAETPKPTLTVNALPKFFQDANPADNTLSKTVPFYTGFYVTAPGVAPGGRYAPPIVQVFDRATGEKAYDFYAYDPKVRDSIRVAVADFNQDGIDDIATTTQHGTGRLRVFDGLTGKPITSGPFQTDGSIAVFDGKKDKGAFVAAGDVDGDENVDIVVGSALGGGKVRVFDGYSGQMVKEYTPFDIGGKKFKGGVRVAVANVDGFGFQQPDSFPENLVGSSNETSIEDDIIVGQGYYGGKVIVYKGRTDNVLGTINVGGEGYKGGVSVAAGDLTGDGRADIVTGRNDGKPSVVEAFRFDGEGFTPYGNAINPFDSDPLNPKNTFGVRVAVVDVNLDGIADIITSTGIKSGSQVRIYDGRLSRGFTGGGGDFHLLDDKETRQFTAYDGFPNVALWVAGSPGTSPRGV